MSTYKLSTIIGISLGFLWALGLTSQGWAGGLPTYEESQRAALANPASVAASTTTASQIGPQVNVAIPGGSATVTNMPNLGPTSAQPAPGGGGLLTSVFQHIPLLSSTVPTAVINNDPVLARGATILGKWQSLVDQHPNDPNVITKPDEEISSDRVIIESLLRANKHLDANTLEKYRQLLVLLKLAQIRNFINNMKSLEKGYYRSITLKEKEGSFDFKTIKKQTSRLREDPEREIVYGDLWYQRQLDILRTLMVYFNKEVLPKIGTPPPSLLSGIYTTMKDAHAAFQRYDLFAVCIMDPTSYQCRAFITEMRDLAIRKPDKKRKRTSIFDRDEEDDEDDEE